MDNLPYQVFGLCFREPGAIEYFTENVPVHYLSQYGKGHAELYRALTLFYSATSVETVDPILFRDWLGKMEPEIEKALGGAEEVKEYISEMMEIELPNVKSAFNLLRYNYNLNTQIEKAAELNNLLEHPTRDDEHQKKVDNLVEAIRDLNQSDKDPMATLSHANDLADRANSLWDLPDFMSTQFKGLNYAMSYSDNGGFCKGAVHAILAQSGKGKSSLAKSICNHWVDNGYKVLYINFEEAVAHWERVLFTQITGKNVYKSENMSPKEKKYYTKIFEDKMREWEGRLLVKHDPDSPYYEDAEALIRGIAASGGAPDAIVIDTIQSMFLKKGSGLPRWAQYEQMMVRLEKLAKDLNSAIIITAQENSNRMKENREVVQQSDIGGSLSIAQKCSVTIFITEAKTQLDDEGIDDTIMQLQIPKNRITGVSFMMNPPIVKYNDETKSYEPIEVNVQNDESTLDVDELEIFY